MVPLTHIWVKADWVIICSGYQIYFKESKCKDQGLRFSNGPFVVFSVTFLSTRFMI